MKRDLFQKLGLGAKHSGGAVRGARSKSVYRGKTYAGGRASSPQGHTPVMGAPGTPIRSSAATNKSTAHTQTLHHGDKKFGGRKIGLANKKRFAITLTAVVAAVLVPVFASTAVSGGTFTSHGVSVERPAVLDSEPVQLNAFSQGAILDAPPASDQIAADTSSDAGTSSDGESSSSTYVASPNGYVPIVEDDNAEASGDSAADTAGEATTGEGQSQEPSAQSEGGEAQAAAEEPTPTPDPFKALEPGVTSDAVTALQERLMELHYMENDEPTDYYGSQTQQAVAFFQRKHGLTVDGYAGPETQARLFSGDAKVYTVSEGAEGSDVAAIQERLEELGYDVSATGYFGTSTSEAVKYFQRMNGITDDGTIGTDTKDILFSEHAEPAIPPEPDPTPEPESESSSGSGESSTESGGGESSSSGSSEDEDTSSQSEPEPEEDNSGDDEPASSSSGVEAFVAAACAQEGKPYVLGGKGPNTFDCSGLVYYALNQSGYSIGYMTSGGWAGSSFPSVSWDNLRRGDVVCMSGHVAVYLGDGMMCDASSSNGRIMIRSMGSWARNNFICGKRVF